MKPNFSLREADYQQDFALLRAVREPVFVIEQNCPLAEEWDASDPLSRHVIAIDDQGQPIGTGRLTPEQRIGRMAVLASARGIGVGAAVLKRLIEIAEDLGYPQIRLSAQVHAIGFYQRYGFQAEGPEYDDAGIAHRLMRRALAAPAAPTGPILFQRSHEAAPPRSPSSAAPATNYGWPRRIWNRCSTIRKILSPPSSNSRSRGAARRSAFWSAIFVTPYCRAIA